MSRVSDIELGALRDVVSAAELDIAARGKIQERTALHAALSRYYRVLAEQAKRSPCQQCDGIGWKHEPCAGCGKYDLSSPRPDDEPPAGEKGGEK